MNTNGLYVNGIQNKQFYDNGFTFENGEYRKNIRDNIILKRDPHKAYWNVDHIKSDGSLVVLKIEEIGEDELKEEILSEIANVGNPTNPPHEPQDAIYEEVDQPKTVEWKKPPTKQLVRTKPIPVSMRDTQVQDLTLTDIKNYICPAASEQEAYLFLQLCKARNLNPFTGEAYLIKYGNQKAQTVVGKETFTRRAELNINFDGFEAGIIIQGEDGTLERRMGTFMLLDEKLVGGWAKVYRKDRSYPFVSEVSYAEFEGKKKDQSGKQVTNSMWEIHGATMIRKVALVQALREAFPSEFSGMYDANEFGEEVSASF